MVCVCVVVLRTPQWTHYLLTGSDSLPAAIAQYQHVADNTTQSSAPEDGHMVAGNMLSDL